MLRAYNVDSLIINKILSSEEFTLPSIHSRYLNISILVILMMLSRCQRVTSLSWGYIMGLLVAKGTFHKELHLELSINLELSAQKGKKYIGILKDAFGKLTNCLWSVFETPNILFHCNNFLEFVYHVAAFNIAICLDCCFYLCYLIFM